MDAEEEAAAITIAPQRPARELRMSNRPVTLTSEAPPLPMALRFMGMGGTVMNARSEHEQLESMFQVNDKIYDTAFVRFTTIGKRDEGRAALICSALRRRAQRSLAYPSPPPTLITDPPPPPAMAYCNFCIHPTFPPLRTTPDFVGHDGATWQIKCKAGAKRRDRVDLHRIGCAYRTRPDPLVGCSCPRPSDWINQIYLEMFTSGSRTEVLGVGSLVNHDYIQFNWTDAVATRWWPSIWPELKELYTTYAEWYWTDTRTLGTTLHARAWLEYYNYQVECYNDALVVSIMTTVLSYLEPAHLRGKCTRAYRALADLVLENAGMSNGLRPRVQLSTIFRRVPQEEREIDLMRQWRRRWDASASVVDAPRTPCPSFYLEWDRHLGARPIGWMIALITDYASEMNNMPHHRTLVRRFYGMWVVQQDELGHDRSLAALPALEVDLDTWPGMEVYSRDGDTPAGTLFDEMSFSLLRCTGVMDASLNADRTHISIMIESAAVEANLKTLFPRLFSTLAPGQLTLAVVAEQQLARPSARKRTRFV